MTDKSDLLRRVDEALEDERAEAARRIAELEAEVFRLAYVKCTIAINARSFGATEEQIADFVSGKASFINWVATSLAEQHGPRPDRQGEGQ